MNVVKWTGIVVFLIGFIVMMGYSVYPIFNPEVEDSTMLFGMKVSLILMGIGAAIALIAMSIERYQEWKKMKEEIDEKELRP